ncbi:unnamed protein product [Porites lobata]|uniref:Uncharacterized protein n=1 Tax=Porites lobata TaxID=104759 RepID=A0ABN8RMT1_9CNID|nr:unnamed protein product [Porites lobata]
MPSDTFRMLICGNSGSGKTNLLYHMLIKPLLYFDEIYLYARNLEQDKYKQLMQKMRELSSKVGYEILHVSNDEITPVSEMDYEDNQKLVIFDDYVCDKNQRQLMDYFIQGRHKNCSVIYLSQSFYKTPKDIRLNCSHYCLYEFPSSRESNRISSELGVDKKTYKAATRKPFTFLYVDKPRKRIQGAPGVGFNLTSSGDYDMINKKLRNVGAPESNTDAATKKYVDDNSGGGKTSLITVDSNIDIDV